jgi:hypothetical protein
VSAPLYKINQAVKNFPRRRYQRRLRRLVIALLLFMGVVGAVLYGLSRQTHNSKPATGGLSHQNVAGPQTFRNQYFEFSDTNKWVYAPNDSTANKLTYLLYQQGLPVHSLTVYVNQTPLQNDLAVTRVLPVQIVGASSFSVGTMSDPCSSLYKPTDLKRIKLVSLSATSFLCVPDSPQYSAVIGQTGGDYNLSLKRSNGSTAHYIIIYRNLSVDPDPTAFLNIMKTFKAL